MRAASTPKAIADEPAFEIKGAVSSLTVLRLRAADTARIASDLATRIAPHDLFQNAPVVVDASCLEDPPVWAELVSALREARLVPVGVTGARDPEAAMLAGLPPMQLGNRLRTLPPESEPSEGEPSAPLVAVPSPMGDGLRPPMTVTAPVRGGQVTYAKGSDLVIVASVNKGAQVIADGSVHVWGPLRGRALAGAQGRRDARILCLALDAELVSVCGEYLMAEEIPDALRGKPAQIFLDGERVRIAPL